MLSYSFFNGFLGLEVAASLDSFVEKSFKDNNNIAWKHAIFEKEECSEKKQNTTLKRESKIKLFLLSFV